MPQYLLLLHHDLSGFAKMAPAARETATEKYMAWRNKPFVVDSKRLAPDAGKVIRGNNGKPHTTDGPYSETKELLGGYYLIEAADYNDAVKRTLDHPHLEYGGTVEVRQLYTA